MGRGESGKLEQEPLRPLTRRTAIGLGVLLLAVSAVGDQAAGPFRYFDVFYLVAALTVTWYAGRTWGVAWVLIGCAAWIYARIERPEAGLLGWIWNAGARVGVWLAVVWLVAKVQQQLTEQLRLIAELRAAMAQIKDLKGLLPVCAWCRRIRDDDGYWLALEQYVGEHTGAQITHGICPECERTLLKDAGAGRSAGEG